MARELRNIGASVRARLLDLSRRDGADFQNLLTRYALERLLYRQSVSAERDRFVLKGAMLFAAWLDDPFRPTGDLDLLGFGDDEPERIANTFRGICAIEASGDGVIFDIDGLKATAIREGADYGGVRVRTGATIGGARVPLQIDIGFGEPLLAVLDTMARQIEQLTKRVLDAVKVEPICRRLMTVPGVGPLTALAFRATVDRPERFRRSRDVGGHRGLTPRRYQSGETDIQGRIIRCGDELARTALYEAAHTLLTRCRKC